MQNMLCPSPDLTPLERAVLSAIHEEHPNDREAIEIQLSAAKLRSRENTGAGFFTYLDLERAGLTPIGGPRLRESPGAKIKAFNTEWDLSSGSKKAMSTASKATLMATQLRMSIGGW
jgi:hypothetical protein